MDEEERGLFCPYVDSCGRKNPFRSRGDWKKHMSYTHGSLSLPAVPQDQTPVVWADTLALSGDEHQNAQSMDLCEEDYQSVGYNCGDVSVDDQPPSLSNLDTSDQPSIIYHTTNECPESAPAHPLQKESVGAEPCFISGTANSSRQRGGTMTILERKIALWSYKHALSKDAYSEIIEIIQEGLDESHHSPEPVYISTKTLDRALKRLENDADPRTILPFQDKKIEVDDIPDFPLKYKEEFETMVGGIYLSYRDIVDLSASIFSDPLLEDSMILRPSIYRRNCERIYKDIDSGEWWQEMQLQIPNGWIVLAIMLSSDQTDITSNGRHKAWPVYLKLGNVPVEIRNSTDIRSSRILAYLPVISWAGKTSPEWLSTARSAIFHHCMSLILKPLERPTERYTPFEIKGPKGNTYFCVPSLATYSADLPEQQVQTSNIVDTI